jgi:hypothetical protein
MRLNSSIYNENYRNNLALNFRNLQCSLPAVIKSKWSPHALNVTADVMLLQTTTGDDEFQIKYSKAEEMYCQNNSYFNS